MTKITLKYEEINISENTLADRQEINFVVREMKNSSLTLPLIAEKSEFRLYCEQHTKKVDFL